MLLGQLEVCMMQWLFNKVAFQRTHILGPSVVNSCGQTQHMAVPPGVLCHSRSHILIIRRIMSLIIISQGYVTVVGLSISQYLNWGLLGLYQVWALYGLSKRLICITLGTSAANQEQVWPPSCNLLDPQLPYPPQSYYPGRACDWWNWSLLYSNPAGGSMSWRWGSKWWWAVWHYDGGLIWAYPWSAKACWITWPTSTTSQRLVFVNSYHLYQTW